MHYVCSDIHGQYELYRRMLKDVRPEEGNRLIILGDVIDRGPEVFPLLLDVMERQNVSCLLGNHEWLMMDYATQKTQGERWFLPGNTGDRTWAQFIGLPGQTRQRILEYINGLTLQLELTIEKTVFLLSHSFFLEKRGTVRWKDVSAKETYNTVWNSPWREKQHVELEAYKSDGRWHVTGHVPVQRIPADSGDLNEIRTKAAVFKNERLVNIDLGCALIPYPDDDSPGKGLCVMCLEDFVEGRDAFRYYT